MLLMDGRSKFTGECAADVTGIPAQSNATPAPKRRRHWRPSAKTRLRTLDELDGRTHAAQHAKKLVSDLVESAGPQCSVGRLELIKRAAILGAFIEDCEVRWLRKEPVAFNEWHAAVNAQRRVLVSIGLESRAAPMLSLGEVLRADEVRS
jgi:hypothetical protein